MPSDLRGLVPSPEHAFCSLEQAAQSAHSPGNWFTSPWDFSQCYHGKCCQVHFYFIKSKSPPADSTIFSKHFLYYYQVRIIYLHLFPVHFYSSFEHILSFLFFSIKHSFLFPTSGGQYNKLLRIQSQKLIFWPWQSPRFSMLLDFL